MWKGVICVFCVYVYVLCVSIETETKIDDENDPTSIQNSSQIHPEWTQNPWGTLKMEPWGRMGGILAGFWAQGRSQEAPQAGFILMFVVIRSDLSCFCPPPQSNNCSEITPFSHHLYKLVRKNRCGRGLRKKHNNESKVD